MKKTNEKTKRIKRVFTNGSQVIHLWANQSQDSARSKNVFFEGTTLYSYGYHYKLGEMITYKGKKLAMVNDRGYSVTTSKHIRWALSAVEHLPHLRTLDFNVKNSLLREQEILIDEVMAIFNRKKTWWSEFPQWIEERVEKFNETCLYLGHKEFILDLNKDFKELITDKLKLIHFNMEKSKSPEEIEKRKIASEKRELAKLKKLSRDIQKWREGGNLTSEIRELRPMLLRVRGDLVETTGGASVPLDHAMKLLYKINKGTSKEGDKIGYFTLNTVQGDLVRIGCHTISLSEARTVLAPHQVTFTLIKQGEENEQITH